EERMMQERIQIYQPTVLLWRYTPTIETIARKVISFDRPTTPQRRTKNMPFIHNNNKKTVLFYILIP
ncbi:MAG: hypothetical protein MI824_17565, partial [Hyphomicrobiales bacterium]|nr:hypothetical protein [Hyphomicrobiales bacterium]